LVYSIDDDDSTAASRFEVPDRSSLVRMPPPRTEEDDIETNKEVVGRARFGLATPAMSRRYPNQARPPAHYTMKKFVAQIYVVDRLYMETI
jgi:hypothetical protein